MRILIEATCRKCGKGDIIDDLSIGDWTQVKKTLVVQSDWKCLSCGCVAAYWYWWRSEDDETLISTEKEKALITNCPQVFACTVSEEFKLPDDFVSYKYNPETLEDL